MLERLARGDAVKRSSMEWQFRQIANYHWDAQGLFHVDGGIERIIDSDDVIAAFLHAAGELPQADCGVEQAGAARQLFHLVDDDAQAVFVPRAEHLRLRTPLMCGQ